MRLETDRRHHHQTRTPPIGFRGASPILGRTISISALISSTRVRAIRSCGDRGRVASVPAAEDGRSLRSCTPTSEITESPSSPSTRHPSPTPPQNTSVSLGDGLLRQQVWASLYEMVRDEGADLSALPPRTNRIHLPAETSLPVVDMVTATAVAGVIGRLCRRSDSTLLPPPSWPLPLGRSPRRRQRCRRVVGC